LVSPITSALCAIVVVLGISPQEDVARETVDLIEVNHFYDEHGRLVFDQVIFYDWSANDARYMVRAWRLVKNPAQLPQRDWKSGGYVAVWQDSCQGGEVLRHVHSQAIRETWTQYDPELMEREYLPKERRRELRMVKLSRPASGNVNNRPPAPPEPTPSAEQSTTAAVAR
jgi:hypothetical protein